MRTRGTSMTIALVASLFGACRKSEAPSPQPTAAPAAEAPAAGAAPEAGAAPPAGVSESVPSAPAPPANPQGQASVLVDVGLGGDPETGVRDAQASFPPGSNLTAGVDTGGLPEGAIVKATWMDASGRRRGEDHKRVEGGVRWLLFNARGSSDWVDGTYRVDILVSTGGSASRTFQIAPGTRPEATPVPG